MKEASKIFTWRVGALIEKSISGQLEIVSEEFYLRVGAYRSSQMNMLDQNVKVLSYIQETSLKTNGL